MEHEVHVQVFNGNKAVGIDNLAAVLMGEVLTLKGDPLMHTGYHLTVFTSLGSSFCQLGMLALHFRKSFFFLTKETRVVNLRPIREGRKRSDRSDTQTSYAYHNDSTKPYQCHMT